MTDMWKPNELVPLYDRATGAQVAHLSVRTSVKDLKVGERVWDDRNDLPCTFDGWSERNGCYLFFWAEGEYFVGDNLDPNGRPATWRRIIDGPVAK